MLACVGSSEGLVVVGRTTVLMSGEALIRREGRLVADPNQMMLRAASGRTAA